MRVRFTPGGRAQFLAALDYVRRDNRAAVVRFRKRAESSLRRLQRFPDSGRRIPEFPDLPFREVIVTPYRFFYRTEGSVVWIVGAWHGAQLPDSPQMGTKRLTTRSTRRSLRARG